MIITIIIIIIMIIMSLKYLDLLWLGSLVLKAGLGMKRI